MKTALRRILGLGLLAMAAMQLVGCKTGDELGSTPWNRPQSWETGGLPSSMTEGR